MTAADLNKVAHHIEMALKELGVDMSLHHLNTTPIRVAKFWEEYTRNTNGTKLKRPKEILDPIWKEDTESLVMMSNIRFSTLCEHHLCPFFGYVAIGYVPDGQMTGLSKLARLSDYLTKGLTIQERLTNQIAEYLQEGIEPRGVGVHIRAEHTCVSCRGIKSSEALTTTTTFLGILSNPENPWRREFIDTILSNRKAGGGM